MKPSKELPPLEYLQECFNYDPETGILYWRVRPLAHFENEWMWKRFNTRWSGTEAGGLSFQSTTKKAMKKSFSMLYQGEKRSFTAHRVILGLHQVPLPPGMVIDHIDGDPSNNRLSNLRVVSHSMNIANNQGYRNGDHSPRTMPRGVYFRPKAKSNQYVAVIGGQKKYLGSFATAKEASEVFEKAHKEMYGV